VGQSGHLSGFFPTLWPANAELCLTESNILLLRIPKALDNVLFITFSTTLFIASAPSVTWVFSGKKPARLGARV
jgi:hypothetical protein